LVEELKHLKEFVLLDEVNLYLIDSQQFYQKKLLRNRPITHIDERKDSKHIKDESTLEYVMISNLLDIRNRLNSP
jgi:hypothetical protein